MWEQELILHAIGTFQEKTLANWPALTLGVPSTALVSLIGSAKNGTGTHGRLDEQAPRVAFAVRNYGAAREEFVLQFWGLQETKGGGACLAEIARSQRTISFCRIGVIADGE